MAFEADTGMALEAYGQKVSKLVSAAVSVRTTHVEIGLHETRFYRSRVCYFSISFLFSTASCVEILQRQQPTGGPGSASHCRREASVCVSTRL